MKKKILVFLLFFTFILSACGKEEESSNLFNLDIKEPEGVTNLKLFEEEKEETNNSFEVREIAPDVLDDVDIKTITDSREFVEFETYDTYSSLSEIANDFNWKYFDLIDTKENILYSSYNNLSTMGILLNGASGKTLREGLEAFGVDDLETLNAYYKDFNLYLNDFYIDKTRSIKGENLVIVDKSKLSNQASLVDDYKNRIISSYLGDLKELDFKQDFNRVKTNISSLVFTKSGNTIKNYNYDLNEESELDIINISYFQGLWEYGFNDFFTKNREFTTVNGESSSKFYMDNTKNSSIYRFYEDDKYIGLALPFAETSIGNEICYLISIMSKNEKALDITSLWKNESIEYRNDFIAKILESDTYYDEIHIYYPRFEIESNNLLNNNLSTLGFSRYFTRDSEINMIYKDYPMFLDKVSSVNKIKIRETGVLDDSTEITFEEDDKKEIKRKELFFNRPFIFMIYDSNYGINLYTGVLNN